MWMIWEKIKTSLCDKIGFSLYKKSKRTAALELRFVAAITAHKQELITDRMNKEEKNTE